MCMKTEVIEEKRTKKQTYEAPVIEVVHLENEGVIAASFENPNEYDPYKW